MKRYRVESKRGGDHHLRVDCTEDELESWKAICKYDFIRFGGKCYYREFPVTKNKRVYYAKENPTMSVDEFIIMHRKLKQL